MKITSSKRAIKADDEMVNLDNAATELLFEAEDVAELVAEVTGEPVDVSVDEDAVVFTVDDTDYTVEAEGDEELFASVRATGKRVQASRQINRAKSSRVIRKIPTTK